MTSRCIPQRIESRGRDLYSQALGSVIQNNQKVETTQMFVSRRLDLVRHGMHTHNVIQPLKGERFTLRTYQVKKKSVTKGQILHNSI